MRLLDVLKWMLAAGPMILGVSAVSGQEFPNKPIRIVAGAAGGGSDFTVRVLAVTSAEPSMLFPGVPTIATAGLAGYETQGLDEIWAPALTPSAVIDRLNRENSASA